MSRAPGPVHVRALLQGGDRRSLGRAEAVAAEALEDPGLVAELVEALGDDDPVVRLRAADALEKVGAERPALLAPHAAALLGPAADLTDPAVRWHLAQLFPRLPLQSAQRRRAVAVLTRTLGCESRVARVMAMDALVRLADGAPRLRRAAAAAVARALLEGSPAERARARRLAKGRAWLARAAGGCGTMSPCRRPRTSAASRS